jgi:hypothetical protein
MEAEAIYYELNKQLETIVSRLTKIQELVIQSLTGHFILCWELFWPGLRGANLQSADLPGVNLDFSVLPLSCGGLRWEVDTRIAAQPAYHLCGMH